MCVILETLHLLYWCKTKCAHLLSETHVSDFSLTYQSWTGKFLSLLTVRAICEQNLSNLKYAVEHIGGLHVLELCMYIHTLHAYIHYVCTYIHTHTHFIDPMPIFTVEYETHQKKYVLTVYVQRTIHMWNTWVKQWNIWNTLNTMNSPNQC